MSRLAVLDPDFSGPLLLTYRRYAPCRSIAEQIRSHEADGQASPSRSFKLSIPLSSCRVLHLLCLDSGL